jgi:hypothetical protein
VGGLECSDCFSAFAAKNGKRAQRGGPRGLKRRRLTRTGQAASLRSLRRAPEKSAEVPTSQQPESHVVLKVPDADDFRPEAIVEVVTPFEDTHWGTREMTIRDPDGRIRRLQAPSRVNR